MGNIGPFQLLIILAIVVLIFGGKRLRSLGSDLGASIKGFKEATREAKEEEPAQAKISHESDPTVIEVKVKEKDQSQS
ncbi:MAG: Sec-independent protein translocase subunit TatA [Cardiobacteriaceae bacterium]|nr:Sec-independent protein translocase subunit TatA [Cardiobacteriaceae bacterium]